MEGAGGESFRSKYFILEQLSSKVGQVPSIVLTQDVSRRCKL